MSDYTDKLLSEGHFLRKFHSNYAGMELDWHRDYNDRTIRVVKGRGWQCQIDDQLPKPMHEGQIIKIPGRTFHRLFSGDGPLIIEVTEGKKKKKLSAKQKKIARAAPPEDEITGADFKALNKNEGNPSQYAAGPGTKRARQLQMTKDDLASDDPARKARAYRRRDRMKKQHRSEKNPMGGDNFPTPTTTRRLLS